MKRISMISFFLLAVMCAPSAASLSAREAGALYDTARTAEQRGDYAGAIHLYKRIAAGNPAGAAAGLAVFKIAVIYDERLHDPNSALAWYKRHADNYGDRNVRRSEERQKALEKYRGADPVKFGEYMGILGSIERKNRQVVAEKLKGFIDANPGLSYLDEALLWLANEYRGSMRKLTTAGEFAGMEKAVVIYRRIVDNYPKGEARLAALKNLGDAYLMKNDYGKAREYYRQVLAEGGEQGRLLIGAHWRLAQVESFRRGVLYGVMVIFCLALGALAYLLPLGEFTFAGVRKGLFHSLFFLPLPVVMTVLTVVFTEPGKSNITGREQYLMMSLTGLLFIGLIINGLVTEAEERVTINFKVYAALLAVMLLCAVYMAFYHFRMLQHIERLFI